MNGVKFDDLLGREGEGGAGGGVVGVAVTDSICDVDISSVFLVSILSVFSVASVFVSFFSLSLEAASLLSFSSPEVISSFSDDGAEGGGSFLSCRNLIALGSTDIMSPGARRVFGFLCYIKK